MGPPESPPAVPVVDFSKATIIAVFMGTCGNGAHGIEVKGIIDMGLTIAVRVEKTQPGRGCIVPMILISPYHIVSVDKVGKYVVFNAYVRTTYCS
jgi:hypothetical protein